MKSQGYIIIYWSLMMNLTEVLLEEKTPDGVYVGVKFSDTTKKSIKNFIKNNKIENPINTEKLHSTLIYSRKYDKNVKKDKAFGNIDPVWIGKPIGFEIWPTQDKKHALVLKYKSKEMIAEHERLMKKYDLTYDYPEFKTHLTLSYAVDKDYPLDKLSLKDFPDIEIISEYYEDLIMDWQNKK